VIQNDKEKDIKAVCNQSLPLNGKCFSSIPANPMLAESLYLNGTIEQMGTGTEDIINLCTQMGLKQPEFKQGSGFEVILYRKTYSDRPADPPTPKLPPKLPPKQESCSVFSIRN